MHFYILASQSQSALACKPGSPYGKNFCQCIVIFTKKKTIKESGCWLLFSGMHTVVNKGRHLPGEYQALITKSLTNTTQRQTTTTRIAGMYSKVKSYYIYNTTNYNVMRYITQRWQCSSVSSFQLQFAMSFTPHSHHFINYDTLLEKRTVAQNHNHISKGLHITIKLYSYTYTT